MSKLENKAFAQMFQKNFAGRFLELYMKLLSMVRENGCLPDQVINSALQYLGTRYGEVAIGSSPSGWHRSACEGDGVLDCELRGVMS
jgi:hypothetical protein